MLRGWSVDMRVMMVGHILTVVLMIDDDRNEAPDDTEMKVRVPQLVTM